MTGNGDADARRLHMFWKVALIMVGAIILGFIAAGIIFSNLRFFIWLGIVALIVWAIVGLVSARRST
jgi:hypothetical protein